VGIKKPPPVERWQRHFGNLHLGRLKGFCIEGFFLPEFLLKITPSPGKSKGFVKTWKIFFTGQTLAFVEWRCYIPQREDGKKKGYLGGKVDIGLLFSEGHRAFLDGAMGTELMRRGLQVGDMPELWNLERPEEVLDVQRAYVEAGAQILLTNTFGGNRLKLRRAGIEDRLEEVNRRAAEIAREASEGRALVAGNIGPTGEFVEPYGTFSEEEFYRIFREQAEVLASYGVDLFVIETMADMGEAKAAVRACRELGFPVAASMSFDPAGGDFHTMMGVRPEEAARGLEEAGADLVGANCGGVGPDEMARVVGRMEEATRRPLFAEPNAGKPELVDGKAVYQLSPEAFVEGMRKVAEAGAKVLGGCCGTTPEHIRLLVRELG